jgi:TPR repeat protein
MVLRYFLFIYVALLAPLFAEGGHIQAFVEAKYADGKPEEARAFIDSLEENNIPEALYVKGILYLNGCYGKPDARQATIYFAKAAALNYPCGIRALADSYLEGDGAEQNVYEAFRLYKQAADFGDGPAQFNVAVIYRDGVGTEQSYKKAIYYFKLAEQNEHLGDVAEDAYHLRLEVENKMKQEKDKACG